MPEYLAPGVYVEEVSYRSKSIEGVSTTTTGFIGPTRYGPVDVPPDVITSLVEFERVYGDRQRLNFYDPTHYDDFDPKQPPTTYTMHNFMWHAVRAFFEQGGKRLYIVRTYRPPAGSPPPADGRANVSLPTGGSTVTISARFPGASGKMLVRLTLRLGQNILGATPSTSVSGQYDPTLGALSQYDVVWISDMTSPISSPPGSGTLYSAQQQSDGSWQFVNGNTTLMPNELTANPNPKLSDQIKVLTLTVTIPPSDPNGASQVWNSLPLDPRHETAGLADSFSSLFQANPSSLAQARSLPLIVTLDPNTITSGVDLVNVLLNYKPGLMAMLDNPNSTDLDRSIDLQLDGGFDGFRPEASDYEGEADPASTTKTGLKAFEDIEDISIIAAPGSTYGLETDIYRDQASQIVNLLIDHAENMRYRIAVLDSGDGQSISDVRAMRGRIDSTYAAIYYPWVTILDPVTQAEVNMPPSGFVAGIYARNDINRAVYKAPANEVVNLALGFEQLLNKAQQDVLNPEGINCFRYFEGRGYRLWGARTVSSDPEWKYVNLRRYFIYLEHSIDRGTQWAVFEPNGPALWDNVRRTIDSFLFNEWQMGALLGDKPEKAYFVKCDRSTMTQNDLDNGRLVCLIGVAPLRPAEFVIFRIGQWTADAKV